MVLVRYHLETHRADIPWQDREFVLAHAVLLAVEALTYQIVAASPAQGSKLGYGTRALVQLFQQKYAQALGIRRAG